MNPLAAEWIAKSEGNFAIVERESRARRKGMQADRENAER